MVCIGCKYAEVDYISYYGTTDKTVYLCGCGKEMDNEANECEGFEEARDDE